MDVIGTSFDQAQKKQVLDLAFSATDGNRIMLLGLNGNGNPQCDDLLLWPFSQE